MECQRHNSEAVMKSMDEKLKEKEKEHRFVVTDLYGQPCSTEVKYISFVMCIVH